jgi:glutamine synthetase
MSQLAYHFLGGLITHARALTAVVAPTVNDYKRLSVGEFLTGVSSGFTWTPACISWGDNNRTQMFRTPDAGRFECRVVSGSVNPYLGLAAFIGAGLDGIARRLAPGEPFLGNLYDLSLSEIKARKLEFVPQSLPEALAAFEEDAVVQSALGPELTEEFLKVKRMEWVRYHNTVSPWEIETYLTLF